MARSSEGLWYFGCYGKTLLITNDQFELQGKHAYDCSLGIQPLGDGLFLSASGKTTPELGCLGKVQLARKNDQQGLKIIPAQTSDPAKK